MSKLILLRHGQSIWNKKNIFTGWIDIPLSPEGIQEAEKAGKLIQYIPIDLIFTSTLIRGIMTALLAMNGHSSGKIPYILHPEEREFPKWRKCYDEETLSTLVPVVCAWELNERMYGQLQGLNKQKMKEQFGEEQIQLWRRSFDCAPPGGESLKMTKERTLPFFEEEIMPQLEKNKNVLIAAHGNSLRSIVMQLEKLNEQEIVTREIPTGQPLIYTFDQGAFSR